jgi:prepilin-type N-terminal cleavage/methylation domain-containing protein
MKPIPLLIRNAFSLVELLVVIAIIAVLIALLIPAIQKARASAANAQCVNNMKQMGLGLQQHHDVHGYFPYLNSVPWVIPPGKPRFFGWKSWLTQILPYIEQDDVQKQLQSTEEFFKATPTFISVFLCPSDPRENAGGTYPWRVFDDGINQFLNLELAMTSYQGIRGKSGKDWPAMGFDEQGVFAWRDADNAALATGVRMSQISDGLSNTIMVGERPPAPDNSTGWWWSADSLWAIMEGQRQGHSLPRPSLFLPRRSHRLLPHQPLLELPPGRR